MTKIQINVVDRVSQLNPKETEGFLRAFGAMATVRDCRDVVDFMVDADPYLRRLKADLSADELAELTSHLTGILTAFVNSLTTPQP